MRSTQQSCRSYRNAGDRAEFLRGHGIFIQLIKLTNTLKWMRGEDLITHLGLEY